MKLRKFTYVLAAEAAILGGLVIAKGEEFVSGVYNYVNHLANPTPVERTVKKQEIKQESGLESKLKSFSGFEHVDQYDDLIIRYTNFWNNEFGHNKGYQGLDANLVKSMICQESGSQRDKEGAFRYDPMQIANAGDYALRVLQTGSETGISRCADLIGVGQTPRRNGRWDYSNSKMTPDLSIKYGIRWLIHKACRFNGNGEIAGFRPWEKALERYNGRKAYAVEVMGRLK